MIRPSDARERLQWLGTDPLDIRDVLRAQPADAAERTWVADVVDRIRANVHLAPTAQLPLPANLDRSGMLTAHACLETVEDVLAQHSEHNIPEQVSRDSLNGLALNLARHRRIYRRPGLDGAGFVVKAFSGLLFRLGRLVFERDVVGPAIALSTGRPHSQTAIGIHVPIGGRLESCHVDSALARAQPFFSAHYPDEYGTPTPIGHCRSWLLDPRLAAYLPEQSNIRAFARRFRLSDESEPADESIVRWVFETPTPGDLARLRPKTSLESAILEHLEGGGHWRVRLGWLEFPAVPAADQPRTA